MALFCLISFLPFSLWANTIVVTTKQDGFADDGLCTLAEAITTANSNSAVDTSSCAVGSGADTIEFLVSDGSILLASALPVITESLVIKGPGADRLAIDGAGNQRIFSIDSGGNAQTVAISGLTLRNGREPAASGGGILVSGDTLNLSDCVISNNSALGGGGIFNAGGTVTISRCTISDNTASASQGGGNGGGISNGGTMTIETSTISGNTANEGGGGVFNAAAAVLTVKDSTLNDNHAVTSGGGIYQDAAASLDLSNTTISGNLADDSGAGVFTKAALTMSHVTITENIADNDNNFRGAGGGLTIDGSGFSVAVGSSILANNKVGSGGLGANRDCSGTFSALGAVTSNGSNLFGDFSGCTGANTLSDVTDADPRLATLANNGGPTATHAILTGSVALEVINCPAGSLDQRSVSRPQDSNNDGTANCDIGAYERSDPDNVDLVLAMDDGINAVTQGDTITWQLSVRNLGPSSATAVVLTDTLPAGTTFVSASHSGCTLQTGNVVCNLGSLAVRGRVTVDIVATADALGPVLNTATVSSAEVENIAADNTASEETLIQSTNTAPQALNDAYETVTNTAVVTGNVLDNDEDADGDKLVVAAADSASAKGGTVLNNGDGTFKYTPADGFIGSDSFNYTASDQRGGTNSAIVNITVKVPPKKPGVLSFSSPAFSVKEGAEATIKLRRTGGSDGVVSVDVVVTGEIAIEGEDYLPGGGTITWQNGDTGDKSLTIVTLDDTLAEGDETINLTLTNVAGGAALGGNDSAVLTIVDDDVSDVRNIIISGTEKQRSGAGAVDALLLLLLLSYASLRFRRPMTRLPADRPASFQG